MMNIMNKSALFIAIGIIGYLMHSVLNLPASAPAGEGKEIPAITGKMLNPAFLEPQAHASPADGTLLKWTGTVIPILLWQQAQ